MSKKSKQNGMLDLCLLGAGSLFGLLTLLMMIAPAFVMNWGLGVVEKYNFYQLINFDDQFRVGIFFGVIFAALLLVAALLLLVLKLLSKKTKLDLLVALCAAVLGLIAGVLMFCMKPLVGVANTSVELGVGAILGGIFSIVAAVALGFYAVKKLLK